VPNQKIINNDPDFLTFGYKRELNPLKFINGGFLLNQQDRWVCVSRNNYRRQGENKDNVTDILQ